MGNDHQHPVLRRVPRDWRVVRIDDLFEIQQGKQVSARHRGGDRQRAFLRTKNVYWGKLDLANLDVMHFSEEDERRLHLLPGDLLTCEGGWVGRTAMWGGELKDCLYQNHLHRLRRKSTDTDPLFTLYWLWYAFEIGGVYFGRHNVTTIPNLSKSRLSELPMPCPRPEEQRLIATVLSTVQRAIERQERLIALTVELKKALMHRLFTEGTSCRPTKQTRIGQIPEHWAIERFDSRYNAKLGKMLSQKSRAGANARPYLRNKNVQWGRIDLEDLLEMDFDEKERQRLQLRVGDLLVCEGGEPGRAAIWPGAPFECYYQKALHRVRPLRADASNEYLFCWLMYSIAHRNLYGTAGASSTIAHLPSAQLNALPIPFPDRAEQDAISHIVSVVERSEDVRNRTSHSLRTLFRTLLHQIMTAQVRVQDLDISRLGADGALHDSVGAA